VNRTARRCAARAVAYVVFPAPRGPQIRCTLGTASYLHDIPGSGRVHDELSGRVYDETLNDASSRLRRRDASNPRESCRRSTAWGSGRLPWQQARRPQPALSASGSPLVPQAAALPPAPEPDAIALEPARWQRGARLSRERAPDALPEPGRPEPGSPGPRGAIRRRQSRATPAPPEGQAATRGAQRVRRSTGCSAQEHLSGGAGRPREREPSSQL